MAPKNKEEKTSAASDDRNLEDIINGLYKAVDLAPVNLLRGTYVENTISSGSLALDLILGGGWAGGRWSVAFGGESAGKSTLSFFAMAAAVRQKIPVFHFDPEGAADPSYMNRIGLKTDWSKEAATGKRVYYRYSQPDYGEQVFRLISRILKELPDVDPKNKRIQAMFVIDSLPFLQPQRRFDNDEASPMAAQARMYAENINLIKSPLAAKNCVLYAVNQIRLRPGVSYGNPEYEPCGETPKHASDLRLRISKRSVPSGKGGAEEREPCWDGRGDDRYVYAIARTIKNKMFSPFRETWLRIWFEEKGMPGRGIDPVYDTYQYLSMTGQLEEKRGFFTIKMDGYGGDLRLTWQQFKALVLDPAAQKEEKTNIRALCDRQFPTGEAFERYFGQQGGEVGQREGIEVNAEEKEEDAKVEAADASADALEKTIKTGEEPTAAGKKKRKSFDEETTPEAVEA